MMLKKEDSNVAIICVIFLVSLLIFEFTPSSIFSDFLPFNLSLEIRPKPTVDRPPPPPSPDLPSDEVRCDRSNRFYDVCSINVPTVLDSTLSTLYVADPKEKRSPQNLMEKVRPYTRKFENRTMSTIDVVRIVAGPPAPRCKMGHRHSKSAIVYSAGGFTGNFFHDFNDGFVPLFVTVNSLHFNDEDVILVVENVPEWWVRKYSDILKKFSKHPIINLDTDKSAHCFPSATVGLISHGYMTIDPNLIPNSKSFLHFRSFLGEIYDHKLPPATVPWRSTSKPRLILVARKSSSGRAFTNQNELKKEAEELGFEVVLFEPTSRTTIKESYRLLNSSHAMIGIHGAGLTHFLFMRPGSAFLQVVPIGVNWLAEVSFGSPARQMGLKYVEYRIGYNESTLSEKYREEDPVIRNAPAFKGENWMTSNVNIYLRQQGVKLNMSRFRGHLKEVYANAKKFMENEGIRI